MIISKDNFVTDNMTNTVCYSSLLPKESSGLDPQLREKMYAALKESVKTFKHYDLYNTRDIWSRDYMPVHLTERFYVPMRFAGWCHLSRQADLICSGTACGSSQA